MKAVVVDQIGDFRLADIPRPEPGPGEVLIKTAVTGLCRTDLKIIEVGHRDLVLPRVPGEEVVGTVCALGPDVDSGLMGKRVYVYPGTSCGTCRPCQQGAGNLCTGMQIMGFHRDGGFAEYVAAPVASIMEIPKNCSFDQAVTAEPLSCCLNALELSELQAGERVGIWGGGPAGAFLAQAAKALGANATVIEPHEARHRYHEQVLSSPGEERFDVAVVAVGAVQPYHEAIERLNPRGRLMIFSGLAKDAAQQPIDLNSLHYMEQKIIGAYGCSYRHGQQALELISSGKVQVENLISHRMQLDELGQALDLVRNRAGMKILLYP
ncbi:MAG: alcohol dehydrogenase catalytic domain-containing protein [Candidatus Electrothrix aestuarii]|uniref:Alcohol dehydrogenase catalytic domain-containing protein n=1 Tax=Candidatus Electrothrix aestuarii TaxID=3062594 RepID=A0AAU8LVG3_9BACT|nr:alcohol dehydrogenase catalytic domain-containing protein [Candidatus Electrothrix aestuarii]